MFMLEIFMIQLRKKFQGLGPSAVQAGSKLYNHAIPCEPQHFDDRKNCN
jgi:hypothetical protein